MNLLRLLPSASVSCLSLLLPLSCFFSFSQNKFRKEQLKAQEAKIAHQEQLLHSTILTQEKERQRIAKDLHDEVGSKLNVIHLHLHQLLRKAPEAQEHIHQMTEVLNDTIQTSRRISHDLLPPTLEKFGLPTAVEELCEYLQQSNALHIQYQTQGERPKEIDPLVELNIFRVLNELLNNTLKYAAAKTIDISLQYQPRRLQVIYRDDGKGFDITAKENQKGLGMKNIDSRLQMIGASYVLQSAQGEGLEVRIEVDWKAHAPTENGLITEGSRDVGS